MSSVTPASLSAMDTYNYWLFFSIFEKFSHVVLFLHTPWSESYFFYFPFLFSVLHNLLLFAKKLLQFLKAISQALFSAYSIFLISFVLTVSITVFSLMIHKWLSLVHSSPLSSGSEFLITYSTGISSGPLKFIMFKIIFIYSLFLPQTWWSSTVPYLSKSPPSLKFPPLSYPLAPTISDGDELITKVCWFGLQNTW